MVTGTLKEFAQRRPAVFMIAMTYAWSWAFFFSAFGSWHDFADLRLAFFLLGAFGPAVAGILTVRLQSDDMETAPVRWTAFLVGVALAAAALILLRTNFLGVAGLQGTWLLGIHEEFSALALVLYLLPVLVSGWVFCSIQSRKPTLRQYFTGLIPSVSSILLLVPLLLFLPALLIGSNLLATLLGMEYQTPKYQSGALMVWLPVMLVKLFTVAMLTGGNEEHGWRGVLLPILQRKVSPLVSTVVIAIVWELWHFPVILSGLYGEGSALAIVAGRLILTLPVTLIFTALYNVSRGSLFLCVAFHACLNTQISFFFGSSLAIPMALIVATLLAISLKMWSRGAGHDPINGR